jgi:hypothetical protein
MYFAGISRINYYKARKRLSVVQFTSSICSDAPSDQATPDHDTSVDQSISGAASFRYDVSSAEARLHCCCHINHLLFLI